MKKLNISLVVAMDNNRAIGKNNQLLWHLPNDLKRFKNITINHPVIMGSKTYQSILNVLGKPLPQRDNLVLTSKISQKSDDDVFFFKNIENLLDFIANKYDLNTEIMIIGGSEIFNLFLNISNKIYLTLVDANLDGDVYFPELDNSWQEIKANTEQYYKDEKHMYNYTFLEYIKIK